MGSFLLQMADWTFKQALAAIWSPSSIPASVLDSQAGLCLGNICFVELCMTLRMCTISFKHFEQLLTGGSFNSKCKVVEDYSHSTAILLAFVLDADLTDIASMGISMMVHQCGGLLASIDSVMSFLKNICGDLKHIHKLNMQMYHTYVMLFGNYGRHMAFATDLPYCIVYTAEYYRTKDPQIITILNPENHPATMVFRWHASVLTPGIEQSTSQLHENTS